MNKNKIIKETKEFVRKIQKNETTGHDWWHTYRVWKMALNIGKKENADMFVVQLAALLHDVDDWKFKRGKNKKGKGDVRIWLEENNVNEDIVNHVCDIIDNMSFKGLDVKLKIKSKEGRVVQDADRLDAIGAVGIARVFAYHSKSQRLIYDPEINLNSRVTDMRKEDSHSSIHHFYDKLFHVKKLMNTRTGKKIAINRHEYTKNYLKQFIDEWYGKK